MSFTCESKSSPLELGRLVDSDLGEKQAGYVDPAIAHARQLKEATWD
jgi:hypothetical protein